MNPGRTPRQTKIYSPARQLECGKFQCRKYGAEAVAETAEKAFLGADARASYAR
jgi:hypothetical protein